MSVPHYPKVWNLGNDAIENLFKGEVEITEKVDGSLFGFGVDKDFNVVMRSKGQQIFFESHDKMFEKAVDQIEKRQDQLLRLAHNGFKGPFFVYGEFLNKPKHNVLVYERVPKDNIIIYGLKVGQNFVRHYELLKEFADDLGFETVPLIYKGTLENDRIIKSEAGNVDQVKKFGNTRYDTLQRLIHQTMSVLGDVVIEGVVIKNYKQLTSIGDPTACFGKHVREDFKEKLHKEWGGKTEKGELEKFIDKFRTEARWEKAIQHFRDDSKLTNSPKDIGPLMKEVQQDLIKEEEEFIKKVLFHHFIKRIKRKAVAGFPEFYKEKLLQKQCEAK